MSRLGLGWGPAPRRGARGRGGTRIVLSPLPPELSGESVRKCADECLLLPVGVGKTLQLGVSVPLAGRVETRSVDLGVFFGGGGGRPAWWQVLLETSRKLAALPFFFPPPNDSKPGTSGVGGGTKAPSIPFINKANQISHAPKAVGLSVKSFVSILTLSSRFLPPPLWKRSCSIAA